jgi:lipopolysaccharide export system protein LptA
MIAFRFLFGCVLAAVVTLGSANAQVLNATADSLVAGQINGQPVKQMIGHVQFVQGAIYGSADKAVQYLNTNQLDLIGNVAIHQDTLALYAPLVTYYASTQIGHAEGGVRLFDRDVELTAENGDYDMANQVAHFHNHVTVTQGKNTSVSDNLTYYRSSQTSILTGHAQILSDSGSLVADTITYVRALGETTAEGNVHLSNDSVTLASDWFYNSRQLGEMLARGRVAVHDIQNNTTIFGDTLARFSKNSYTVVPRYPLLLYIDSSQVKDSITRVVNTVYDTMFLHARTMEMYQGDSARFIATDSVRMLRSNFSAIGGTLIYDEAREIMTISHSPQTSSSNRQRIWNDSTEIDADSVLMLMTDRHINRIFGIGHAFATSPVEEFPNSGRIDQLEGERMMLVITQDTARQLYDMSNALSIYFLINQGKPDGVNRASGDTIRMDFKYKTVVRLAVISGTEGEYFPERFVGNTSRAEAFHLADYERHTELRPRREEFFVPWAAIILPSNLEIPASDNSTSIPSPAKQSKQAPVPRRSAH